MLRQSEKLGTEKISTLLYQLSLPGIIAMLVNSLYNIVDTVFVGHGVGPMAIGGLAIAFPIQMLSMGFSQLIGMGAASSVSRYLGAKNTEKADIVAGNAYTAIVIISALFAAVGLLFTDPMLRLFGATESLIPYARGYTKIIFYGSIFFSFTMTANGMIQSEGNAKVPMFSTIIGGVLNMALDPIFIFVFDMGIDGAAWATIISQFISFLFVFHYLLSGKSSLKVKLHHLKLRWDILREILTIGSSAFTRTITGTIFSIVINNSLKFYGGDAAITVFGIINRIIGVLFLPVIGIVQGMQPIAGYNYGAGNIDRVKETVRIATIVSTIMSVIGWIIGETIPHIIIRAFTSDEYIVTTASNVLRIMISLIPVMGIQFVGATLFQSLGKAGPAIILSLLRQFIILTPLILILPRIFNLELMGVWLSFPLSDLIAVGITVALIKSELRKLTMELGLSQA
ncbi:multidrug export protein MepA [Oxobacter pfennigii]|uniref:Multidrug export protein MepA n=1 Tax=Oxobacter pfennigii TaxID=36849 RepID=A0A0P9AJS9_9CLOT|nr:MATE family efflux transporter [Oxobacter pfennigii]KPU45646.1 multidrug export protein MepA [Oxobacter pfennigii]